MSSQDQPEAASERIVLCGANSYLKKYFFNEQFSQLPQAVKDELQIICVSFTEAAGGIMTLEFGPEDDLQIHVMVDDADYLFDEIESGLQISRLQREKEELFSQLETFRKVQRAREEKGAERHD